MMIELMHTDLPEPGGAGDEHMGHLGQVGQNDVAGDIPAQRHRQPAFRLDKGAGVDNLPEGDGGDVLVGHLDAHRRLAGDRGLDAHAGGRQIEGDVIRAGR